jgi:hypothetical protein
MIDAVDRRSFYASASLHVLVLVIVLMPAWLHRTWLPQVPPPPPPAPKPSLRLVLAPMRAPAPPPLPPIAPAAQAGWAAAGAERFHAEVVTPLAGGGATRDGEEPKGGQAPVSLPRLDRATMERALRLDEHAWSEREITHAQEQLGDAATLVESLVRAHLATDWSGLGPLLPGQALYLEVQVDDHGTVVAARRLSSAGAARVDEAIDRWLHDPQAPLGLPPIQPGRPHVLRIELNGP